MAQENPFGAPGAEHVFGGGSTESVLHPAVLAVLLVVVVLTFALPRKYIVIPVLFVMMLSPQGQQLYLAGVHWSVIRILVLMGLIRLCVIKFSSKKSLFPGGTNGIDRAFFTVVLIQTACFVLQYMQFQALLNQFGFLLDFLGSYVLLRALIQNEADVYRGLKTLAGIAAILGISMLREHLTGQNMFGLLGGVQLVANLREGTYRAQGAFQHALTAGTFAATLLPLFFMLWKNGKAKVIAGVGVVGCTVMTLCSYSSTPELAYVAGLAAVCLWPVRKNMRVIRWGLVLFLVGLNFVMKAPVWFFIAHIDLTGGSSGYHRAELIDQFIRHFWDWWLIGTKDAGTWGYDLWDTQNQYVNVGQTGGLGAFVFFIVVIVRSWARIGESRKQSEGIRREWMCWFLGAALFANVVGFFGVNYYDQSKIGWFVMLAMISAATVPQLRAIRTASPLTEDVTDAPMISEPLVASCAALREEAGVSKIWNG
jgi:hypothetical protein